MGLFSGASAGVKLDADSTGYRREVKRAASETKKQFGALKRETSGLRTAFKGLAVGLGAGIALAVGSIAKAGFAELSDAQKKTAQTVAVIKSTGSAANVSAAQVQNLASAISRKTGIDDQAIQAGQNMLLTFTNIRNEAGRGNDIFNQASKTVTDLAVAMGTEPQQAAMQLGKALNDPAKGVTKLTRVGVTFTEQQKKQIDALQKAGRTADAQKIIIAELNKEFGGSAEAFGKTLPGQIAKAKNAFDDVSATIVAGFMPAINASLAKVNEWIVKIRAWADSKGGQEQLAALADGARKVGGAIGAAAKIVGQLVGALIQHRDVVIPLVAGLLAAVAAYRAFVIISTVVGFVRALTAGQLALNLAMIANPVGLVVAALVGLGVALVVLYKKSDTFRGMVQTLWGWIKKATSVVMEHKIMLLGLLGPFGIVAAGIIKLVQHFGGFRAVMSAVKSTAVSVFNSIVGAVGSAVGFVRAHWKPILAILTGPIGAAAILIATHWGKIKSTFSAGVSWIVGKVGHLAGVLAALPGKALAAGMGIASSLKSGVVSAFKSGGNWLADASRSFANAVIDILNQAIPNKIPIPGPAPDINLPNSPIPRFARGGRLTRETLLVAGEDGDEQIVPLSKRYRQEGVANWLEAAKALGIPMLAKGGRTKKKAPTPAQVVAAQLAAAGQRATVAASPTLGAQQAAAQLAASAAAAAAAQKKIDTEKKTVAALERQLKSAKKGSAEYKRIDAQLAKHKKALDGATTAYGTAKDAQTGYADSVVQLRQQIEDDRKQAEADAKAAAEQAAQELQDQARGAADRQMSLADAQANLAAAYAEATATTADDIAAAQQALANAAARAATIQGQLGRTDITEETRVDLTNQLAEAVRSQKTLTDNLATLTGTATDGTGGATVAIDPEQMQQLIASNDSFLAGLRDTLRSERSNVTIHAPITTPQVGVNQFLETMRYKLTQVGAGGGL